MAKKAFVYDGTQWVDIAQSTADLSNYANLTTNQPSFRNFLINGGMDIAQRGTSLTRGNTADYGLDRWYVSGFGSGQNFTVSRSTATPPTGFQYFQRVATTTTTSTNLFVSQSLETSNVVPLQGKTATLSFRYRVPVNFTGTWTANVLWSTATDTNLTPSTSRTVVASKSLTNTTSWTTDSLTFTVPATATALTVEFALVNNVVNGAQFDFTGVQLELGSIVTPFERRPIGTELALCQRYYQTSFNTGQVPAHNASGNGIVYHPGVSGGISGNLYTNLKFYPMRTFPTVSIFNGNNASAVPASGVLAGGLNTTASGIRVYTAGGAGFDSTNIGIDYIRTESISLYAQSSSITTLAGLLAFGYALNAEL